jgi:4-hydroxybenzoate polyprenyltransferase
MTGEPVAPARTLIFARLVRLPNVFTAIADISLGAIVAGVANLAGVSLALAASSSCLYCSGMVWNDLFDIEQDARERPFRPLPAGQVTLRAAALLASLLLIAGIGFAIVGGWFSPAVAGVLAGAILFYDRWLKRTVAGPLGMGLCRYLNVLLGLSATDLSVVSLGLRLHLAAIVAIYVTGITWFARREAAASRREQLRAAAIVMAAGVAIALPLPLHAEPGNASFLFPYLLVLFGFLIGMPVVRAIAKPDPPHVQAAVKRAVLGIIGLDAVLATAISGAYGLLILILLPPALWLGRRIYST